MRPLLAVPLLCLAGLTASGDEAVFPSGKRMTGQLQGEQDKIVFVSDHGQPVPLAQLHLVRFTEAPCPLPSLPVVQRLMLPGGQWLSGKLLAVNAVQVHFRAFNGQDVKLPRGAVLGVAQPCGWHILSHGGFEKETPGWKLSNPPSARLAFAGKKSLVLDRPGQEAVWTLATSPARGRVGLFLHQNDKTAGQELHVDWTFRVDKESRQVRLTLDGTKMTALDALAVSHEIAIRAGWHLIQVDFGGDSLRLSVDDLVLCEPAMKGAVLSGVKMRVTKRDRAAQTAGGWSVDDVQLARPEGKPDLPWPRALADADSVWLADGDQLFGKVTQADARSVTLAAKFGTRTFAWPAVRGVVFQAKPPVARPPVGSVLTIAPAPGLTPDSLEGYLLRVSRDQLTIRHATLGELTFDRRCCQRIKFEPRP